jgi:hypothetical protein
MSWDFMTSREAREAMLRKLVLEVGTKMITDKVIDYIHELDGHNAAYKALLEDHKEALQLWQQTPIDDLSTLQQLRSVIHQTNISIASLYQVEKVDNAIGGLLMDKFSEKMQAFLFDEKPDETEK